MIAWIALWSWPALATAFFKRQSLPLALCMTIMGGYLLLPVALGIDLPMLPPFDKDTIPTLAALVLTAIALKENRAKVPVLTGWIPRSRVVVILLLLLWCGILGTVLTNRDPLAFGWRYLPGHDLYDASSMLMSSLIVLGPFFLGRKVLGSQQSQKTLLKVLVFAAIPYSFLALYEVRMSPQFHAHVYGYSNVHFLGQLRSNGWRPTVFMTNGLVLSLFFVFSVLAAAALARAARGQKRVLWIIATLWLFMVVALCNSLGALVITVLLLPVMLLLNTRLQLLAALCIALSVLTFPVLRSAGLVPVDRILVFVENVSPARAQSFGFRIWNEDILLERALERPIFGWGGWGRQRVFTEDGFNLSTTDGSWVIELGSGGWVRYISVFGLLTWPIIVMFFRRREEADPISIGLCIILCAKLIDLIPNSGLGPVTWLVAGSLVGRLEWMTQKGDMIRQEASDVPQRKPSYARGAGSQDAPAYARTFAKPSDAARATGLKKRTLQVNKRVDKLPYTQRQATQEYRK